ncbi:Uncharacterised protein [Vibrio cholerae]|nr:Uncharacterised protein [Vibrio cholerae]
MITPPTTENSERSMRSCSSLSAALLPMLVRLCRTPIELFNGSRIWVASNSALRARLFFSSFLNGTSSPQ